MARRSIGWIAIVVLLCGAGAWWVVRERGTVEPQTVALPEPAAPVAPAKVGPQSIVAPAEPAERENVELAKAAESGELAPLDPATSNAFVGRVVFPAGTPGDERARVLVYDGLDLVARAEVDSSGNFQSRLPKSSKRGRLKLEARYAFLEEPVKFDPTKTGAAIVIEPALGACIRGSLRAPEDMPAGESTVEGATLHLSGMLVARAGNQTTSRNATGRNCKLDAQGRFEFGGLDPAQEYQLRCQIERFAELGRERQPVRAGETTEVELAFQRGVRMSGRVVDEAGAPVEGATVAALTIEDWGQSPTGRETKSGADGSFALQGIPAGQLRSAARLRGWVTARSEPAQLGNGDERHEFVLTLARGLALEGRVTWPDGKPALDARIAVEDGGNEEQDYTVFGASGDGDAKVDESGSFRITGLEKGPFRVIAHAKPELAPAVADGETDPKARAQAEREAKRARRTQGEWRAVLEDVPGNSKALELVLRQPMLLAGTVVDDLDAPLDGFTVSAMPVRGEDMQWDEQKTQNYKDAAGQFSFERLHEGTWRVKVSAKGHADSAEASVEVPGANGELRFVCPRTAKLSGTVIDPAGVPVAGAAIVVEYPELGRAAARMGIRGKSQTFSGKQGEFELESVRPGEVKLTAGHSSFATSEPSSLTIEPGGQLEGIVLSLRIGGAIEGEVILPAGKHFEGSHVYVSNRASSQNDFAKLGADGRFRFDNLAPGRYEVMCWLASTSEAGEVNAKQALRYSENDMKRAEVDVVAGQTAHVVLGGAPTNPVALSGQVTAGGKPVASARLILRPTSGPSRGSGKSAITDADGRYACALDEPGEYRVGINAGGSTNSRDLTVPDLRTVTYDIALDSGRISGRVQGPDQKPLAGVRVDLRLQDNAAPGAPSAGGSRTTESDGSYAFENLSPGVYIVSAGGRVWGDDDGSAYGRRSSGALDLRDKAALEDVDFALGPEASVQVSLRNDGSIEFDYITLYARDASGRFVETTRISDDDGKDSFVIQGLGPGTYSIGAYTNAAVAAGEVAVSLRDGDVRKVELELVPSSTLMVSVEGAQAGSPGFRVLVLDARGFSAGNAKQNARDGSDQVRIDSLAPGTYTVVVDSNDGRSARQEVRVAGGEPASVQVRLAK